MRKNKSYWERRAEDRINRYTEDAEKTADLIGKAYFQAEQYFEEEAKKVFRGFQNAFELSESEAKRLLNVKPNEKAMDSLRKALEKITDPEERNNALAALSSPAYQYRIGRLDKLNEEIAKTCNELYKTELSIDKRFLAVETDKAYKSMMFDIQKGTGISGAFDMLPKSYINQVLNTNWSGEHFSARIWDNTTKLAADLKQDLLVGMLTGQSERDVAASIMERTGTSSFNARRLVRTETTYVTNQAELKSYEEADIDEYEYSACIDGRTSKLCRELDGKTFKVKDGKPGKNLPPMHPFCRSTTLAVLPSEEELDKAFEDFKADNIPEGMDFDEWLDGLEPTEDGKLVFKNKNGKTTVSEGKSDIEVVKGNPLGNSEKYLSYSGGKRVDNGGESDIINTNKAKYIDIFNDYDLKPGDPTPIEIMEELSKSSIGREVSELLSELPEGIALKQGDKPDLRGDEYFGKINIYVNQCKNVQWVVRTIIHEFTHYRYGIGDSQWAECVCIAQELKHARNRNYLTIAEKRTIIKAVKGDSDYKKLNWRKGGLINGRRKSHR